MTDDPAKSARAERRLFGLLLGLQIAVYAWIILGRRMVRGHDTLHLYILEYLFLAQTGEGRDMALWMPFVAHGSVTNWLANFHGGLFQNTLLLLGGVRPGTNHLLLFDLGLFVDELILLVGVWTLGRHYYPRVQTRFFVSVAMIGSVFWANHVYYNFRSYNAVPLILSLLHGFFEDGKRWKLLLGTNLMVMQFTGNVSYFPPLVIMVVIAYGATHAVVFRKRWRERLKKVRLLPVDLLLVLVNGAVLAALYATLSQDASEIRQFRPGRNADATVPLDTFLTHGGGINPVRYLDVLFGLTPSLGYSLYCGIFTIALAVVGLLHRPGKAVLHLLTCLLLVLFFSMGYLSLTGAVSYYLAPPLRYFRYVYLASPFVKMFLILLAGYGFEAILSARPTVEPTVRGAARACLILMGVLVVVIAIATRGSAPDAAYLLFTEIRDSTLRPSSVGDGALGILTGSALAAGAAGVLLSLRVSPGHAMPLVVPLILLLHTADVFHWKIQMLRQETFRLDDTLYALQEIRPIPYAVRRNPDYTSSGRYVATQGRLFSYMATYDITDGYLHVDPPESRFMAEMWMAPFDRLLRARSLQPVDQQSPIRASFGLDPRKPTDPYSKILGVTEDKIQIFAQAHVAGSDSALADHLNHPANRGDTLLLSLRRDGSAPPKIPIGLHPDLLARNERIRVVPTLISFDFNRIALKLDLPAGVEGAWLSYSDVWHPGWTATVNGKRVDVERAFLAYKAIRLEAGGNLVEFRFSSPVRTACYTLVHLNSLFWVAGTFALALTLLIPRRISRPSL